MKPALPFSGLVALVGSLVCTDTRGDPAAEASKQFADGNVFGLAQALETLPATDLHRALYEGHVAAAMRKTAAADEALNRYLKQTRVDRTLRAQAVSTLVTISLRDGRYADAEKYIRRALGEFAAAFEEEEISSLQQSLSVARVLAGATPQTTVALAPSVLVRTHDKVGLMSIDITINHHARTAVFQSDANFCVASESFARAVGLEFLPGEVEVMAATGQAVTGRIGIARDLALGGCHFRQVAFLVFPDADLAFPKLEHAIEAIIGFPVIAELGRVRMHAGTQLEFGLPPSTASAPTLALKGLEPLVAVRHGGRIIPFRLAGSAERTTVTQAFTALFPEVVASTTTATADASGSGAAVTAALSKIPRLVFAVAGDDVVLRKVRIEPDSADAGNSDYGVIGADLLFSGGGYEFDLRAMTFRLLPAPAKVSSNR